MGRERERERRSGEQRPDRPRAGVGPDRAALWGPARTNFLEYKQEGQAVVDMPKHERDGRYSTGTEEEHNHLFGQSHEGEIVRLHLVFPPSFLRRCRPWSLFPPSSGFSAPPVSAPPLSEFFLRRRRRTIQRRRRLPSGVFATVGASPFRRWPIQLCHAYRRRRLEIAPKSDVAFDTGSAPKSENLPVQVTPICLTKDNYLSWSAALEIGITSRDLRLRYGSSALCPLIFSLLFCGSRLRLSCGMCLRGCRVLRTYQIKRSIYSLKQGDLSVASFYAALKTKWEEFHYHVNDNWDCGSDHARYWEEEWMDRTFLFLGGLRDEFESIRSQILNCDEIPGIEDVYARVESEEQRRQVMQIDPSRGSGPSAFVSRSSVPGQHPVRRCTHCHKLGHSVDFCWNLHPEKRLVRGRPPSSRRGSLVQDSNQSGSSSGDKSRLSPDQIKELQAYIGRLSTTPEDSYPPFFDDVATRMLPVIPLIVYRLIENDAVDAAERLLATYSGLLVYHPLRFTFVREILAYFYGHLPSKLVVRILHVLDLPKIPFSESFPQHINSSSPAACPPPDYFSALLMGLVNNVMPPLSSKPRTGLVGDTAASPARTALSKAQSSVHSMPINVPENQKAFYQIQDPGNYSQLMLETAVIEILSLPVTATQIVSAFVQTVVHVQPVLAQSSYGVQMMQNVVGQSTGLPTSPSGGSTDSMSTSRSNTASGSTTPNFVSRTGCTSQSVSCLMIQACGLLLAQLPPDFHLQLYVEASRIIKECWWLTDATKSSRELDSAVGYALWDPTWAAQDSTSTAIEYIMLWEPGPDLDPVTWGVGTEAGLVPASVFRLQPIVLSFCCWARHRLGIRAVALGSVCAAVSGSMPLSWDSCRCLEIRTAASGSVPLPRVSHHRLGIRAHHRLGIRAAALGFVHTITLGFVPPMVPLHRLWIRASA
ncbi:Mediator of RNA polymerase II transcription subunit 23 [Nymphaea thermarum]|nr:Mediator of RNA polymerase II transcription subunit 23 [Nymphaea thermarum]